LMGPQDDDSYVTEFLTPEMGDEIGSLVVSELVPMEEK